MGVTFLRKRNQYPHNWYDDEDLRPHQALNTRYFNATHFKMQALCIVATIRFSLSTGRSLETTVPAEGAESATTMAWCLLTMSSLASKKPPKSVTNPSRCTLSRVGCISSIYSIMSKYQWIQMKFLSHLSPRCHVPFFYIVLTVVALLVWYRS